MTFFGLLVLTCIAGVGIACGGASPTPTPASIPLTTPAPNPTATPEAAITSTDDQLMEIQLNLAAKGSPQQGTAVITRLGDSVKVRIRLEPAVKAQMVTLRYGTCQEPTGFKDTLRPVIGGVMTQDIRDLGMEELTTTGLTLVVSVDDTNYNSIAACAELPQVD
jgi:hypothetical protein